MTDGECEICGGDCSSANPPVYNCPNSYAHARAQAGEPVAAGAWTREDLAAGLAELDGIDLVPPLKSVVDLEYLNRADDLLTFLSVASAANEPLGAIHPAPAQESVAVPRPVVVDVEALLDLPCKVQHVLAERLAANIGYVLVEEPEHPDSPHRASPAESGEIVGYQSAIRLENDKWTEWQFHRERPQWTDDQDVRIRPVYALPLPTPPAGEG